MKKKLIILNNKPKFDPKTLLVVATFMITSNASFAGGLEAVAKSVHGLVMGDLGKAVIGFSALIGGGVALWKHNIGGALGIIGIGALLGFFLSAVESGTFTKLLTV